MRLIRLQPAASDSAVTAEFDDGSGSPVAATFSVDEHEGSWLANPDPASLFDRSDLNAGQVRQVINAVIHFHRARSGAEN